MDKKLQLLQHLYGETDDPDALRELLKDEDLNLEYQELSEAKFWLDHTAQDRPDQTVLDAISAAAAGETTKEVAQPNVQENIHLTTLQSLQQNAQLNNAQPKNAKLPPRGQRDDRAPVSRQPRPRRRLFTSVTAVLALAISVGIGYQFLLPQTGFLNESADQAISAQQRAASANEPLAESLSKPSTESLDAILQEKEVGFAGKDKKLESAPASILADLDNDDLAVGEERSEGNALLAAGLSSGFAEADTSLPDWDDDQDQLLSYQRRIEMLLEQNQDLAWDEAAVPLELLPSGRPANPALLQAGSRKTNTGNQ